MLPRFFYTTHATVTRSVPLSAISERLSHAPGKLLDCVCCRHTWLMAPEEFEAAPSTEMMKSAGPLLRGGFTAPLHMARRCARHGEATKPWRRTAFNVEGVRRRPETAPTP